jgi:hypothetical protein
MGGTIQQSTSDYEAWLGRMVALDHDALASKHARMREGPFELLRASFYRWAERWPRVCAALAGTPEVLGVGDIHVENFGTWRDAEGRLVWGLNDADEAWAIPYASDLVRLATSAALAGEIELGLAEICQAVLDGYRAGLEDSRSLPFVLAERHSRLRELATDRLKDPRRFWDSKLSGDRDEPPELTPVTAVPDQATELFERTLPEAGMPYAAYHRLAGLGSLGRPRLVALADWRGGRVAREAKALAPSSWLWANGADATGAPGGHGGPAEVRAPIRYMDLLDRAVRCPDPTVVVSGGWVVRRLAPDCIRIELGDLPEDTDTVHLLTSMGRELANLHRGDAAADAVRRDLDGRGRRAGWLRDAADAMRDATREDYRDWRDHPG